MTAVAPQERRAAAPAVADRQLRSLDGIELRDVGKTLGSNEVLCDLTLSVPARQIFGLIGPSGCGKTTVVRLLVGLAAPTKGLVLVRGTEPRAFGTRERREIGYTPQGFVLYPTLTVKENARFVAGLYGMGWRHRRRRIREVLEFLELWDARNRLARDISGGMQRRLSLACALFHRPRLVIVDEPTSGLDPRLRAKIWEYLRVLRDGGSTVFVTTQHIEEATQCDRIGIMRAGALVAEGTPEGLRQQALGGDAVDVEAAGFTRDAIAALWQLPYVRRVQWNGRRELRVLVDDVGEATAAISKTLTEHGTDVIAVRPYVPSFDEVFLALVAE